MTIKLVVTYDGTDFSGWQIQKSGRTVQGEIQSALKTLTGEDITLTGSGRTDAGVHALGQVASFETSATIPPKNFAKALNTILPSDVKIISSEQVEDGFNARKHAKKKTYRYSLYRSDCALPLKERYAFRIDKDLDLAKMQDCASALVGENDFKAFCATGSSVKTTTRTIYSFEVNKNGDDITFTVCGNGFLYNMVRIMVGTLIKAGEGKIGKADIEKMLTEGKRNLGGATISAKGLTLVSVEY